MIDGKCVHFILFSGDEYWSAVKLWGKPDFIHRKWDKRASREIDHDCDILIFAQGDETQPVSRFNGDDYDERVFDERHKFKP